MSSYAKFVDFHLTNPHVYTELVRLARDLSDRGHRKIGMKMLFEVLRWQTMMRTTDNHSPFKLNNNYTAHYARLITMGEPDLAQVFEIRVLRS